MTAELGEIESKITCFSFGNCFSQVESRVANVTSLFEHGIVKR